MIKAVIFDFDDTLCLTQEACFKLECNLMKSLGRKPVSLALYRETWGIPFNQAVKKRYPDMNTKKTMELINKTVFERAKDGKFDVVLKENLDALDELTRQGKRLMVLTSRDEGNAKHLLDPNHHLGSRMAAIYHLDNNPYHKPDPRTFEVIEKYHELKPAECVYVGDSVVDAAAAKGAGLHFIASLESGLRTEYDFNNYPVDAFINKLPEVVMAINKLEAK